MYLVKLTGTRMATIKNLNEWRLSILGHVEHVRMSHEHLGMSHRLGCIHWNCTAVNRIPCVIFCTSSAFKISSVMCPRYFQSQGRIVSSNMSDSNSWDKKKIHCFQSSTNQPSPECIQLERHTGLDESFWDPWPEKWNTRQSPGRAPATNHRKP